MAGSKSHQAYYKCSDRIQYRTLLCKIVVVHNHLSQYCKRSFQACNCAIDDRKKAISMKGKLLGLADEQVFKLNV